MEGRNCMNCHWSKEIKDFEIVKTCTNKLSGSYNTDVTKYECCNRYKMAEGEGENEST